LPGSQCDAYEGKDPTAVELGRPGEQAAITLPSGRPSTHRDGRAQPRTSDHAIPALTCTNVLYRHASCTR
jgi:hypothetical protein